MQRVTETMLVSEVMDLDDNITEIFLKNGLNCLGCPGAANESLAEAAEGHDADLGKLVADLNRYLAEKGK